MDWEELANRSAELANEAIQGAQVCKPEKLGLDRRASYAVWRGQDFLAVSSASKASMAYYGGFEYVLETCVEEVGGYMFYSIEDPRVLEHWAWGEEEAG